MSMRLGIKRSLESQTIADEDPGELSPDELPVPAQVRPSRGKRNGTRATPIHAKAKRKSTAKRPKTRRGIDEEVTMPAIAVAGEITELDDERPVHQQSLRITGDAGQIGHSNVLGLGHVDKKSGLGDTLIQENRQISQAFPSNVESGAEVLDKSTPDALAATATIANAPTGPVNYRPQPSCAFPGHQSLLQQIHDPSWSYDESAMQSRHGTPFEHQPMDRKSFFDGILLVDHGQPSTEGPASRENSVTHVTVPGDARVESGKPADVTEQVDHSIDLSDGSNGVLPDGTIIFATGDVMPAQDASPITQVPQTLPLPATPSTPPTSTMGISVTPAKRCSGRKRKPATSRYGPAASEVEVQMALEEYPDTADSGLSQLSSDTIDESSDTIVVTSRKRRKTEVNAEKTPKSDRRRPATSKRTETTDSGLVIKPKRSDVKTARKPIQSSKAAVSRVSKARMTRTTGTPAKSAKPAKTVTPGTAVKKTKLPKKTIQEVFVEAPLSPPITPSSSAVGEDTPPRPAGTSRPEVPSYCHDSLLPLSKKLSTKTPLESKPEPLGKPEVWADDRQSLMETLPYFRSMKSACYTKDGVLFSFYFNDNGHRRDMMDENVLIARAGGDMILDKETKTMVQKQDQGVRAQSVSFRNNIAQQNPLVIMSGNKNPEVPSKMPHRFNVCGWYKPTDCWTEKTWSKGTKEIAAGYMNVIKYRMEVLDDRELPWYAPKDFQQIVKLGSLEPPVEATCKGCHKESLQIYLQSWLCLNGECAAHWKLWDGTYPNEDCLDVDPRWLKKKEKWDCELQPHDVKPTPIDLTGRIGADVSEAATRGMCCPKCGKCSSRYLWRGWKCTNADCGHEHFPPHVAIPLDSVTNFRRTTPTGMPISYDVADPSVKVSSKMFDGCRVMKYEVPGLEGDAIYHIIACKVYNERKAGADAMWNELQTTDIGLERQRMETGERDRIQSYMANFGMPYKFVAPGTNRPLKGANWTVEETLGLMNEWTRKVCREFEEAKEFNEVLVVGYLENTGMGYHDDGEAGLGPYVSAISLGAEGTLSWRLKPHLYYGVTKNTGVAWDGPPLPGCLEYDARKSGYEALAMRTGGKPTKQDLKDLASSLGLEHRRKDKKTQSDLIRATMSHGDIMIMQGARIQKFMDHQASNNGSARMVLTCRTILEEHLQPHQRPTYDIKPDEGFHPASVE